MITTAKDFHISAAGERDFDANQDVTPVNLGNGYRLYLQMFLAVKHGSHHVAFHYDHLCG